MSRLLLTMKCDLCPNPATVFLTQVVNGEMKKIKFCASCAEAQGVTDPTGFALADFLIGQHVPKAMSPTFARTTTGQCPSCGFSLDDLKKIGRLGCPSCYSHFHSEITPTLREMHGASNHAGKIPTHSIDAAAKAEKIQEMTQQLEAAIAEENFELAAELRDQLKALTPTT